MSHMSRSDQDRFHRIADEVRDVFSERGHTVDVALDADSAFRKSAGPRSQLTRELVADGVAVGASKESMHFHRPNGSIEIQFGNAHCDFQVRLRRAERTGDGDFRVPNNAASTWGDADEDTLRFTECWILGFTLNADGTLADLFLAEVLGVLEGSPGKLLLGVPILLGTGDGTSPFGKFFKPSDEPLFDDDSLGDGDEHWGEEAV